ncbi:MAG: serine/threonine-protein kinase, partial [Nannocystaceae bacterium]
MLGNRYELVERVARGGTGTVFRGYDRSLDRTVAIKVAYAGETKVREHLLREARIGAKIHHPSLMPVLDHGYVDEYQSVYIVMPFIAGPSLRARVNAGALPWPIAGAFVHQLLVGLAVLHSLGVVHRDVKSDNCLLSHDLTGDRLILADFGLARADLLRPPPGHQSPLVGSIGYLAPERLHTRGDARTDVYAAGVVLFEALTRRLPFRGPQ